MWHINSAGFVLKIVFTCNLLVLKFACQITIKACVSFVYFILSIKYCFLQNLLKKNRSAVACQWTCVPSTQNNARVVGSSSFDSDQWERLTVYTSFLLLSAAALPSSHALSRRQLRWVPLTKKVCPCFIFSGPCSDQWRPGMLGSWLFRSLSSSFRNSLFSQVAMHSWFMICPSTPSLSGDLFLAGQASAAKGHFAGPHCSCVDWIQGVARLLAAVGNPTEKGDNVYVRGFIGVDSTLAAGWELDIQKRRKSLPRSAPFTELLRLNELSFARWPWPHAGRSRSAAPGNACGR